VNSKFIWLWIALIFGCQKRESHFPEKESIPHDSLGQPSEKRVDGNLEERAQILVAENPTGSSITPECLEVLSKYGVILTESGVQNHPVNGFQSESGWADLAKGLGSNCQGSASAQLVRSFILVQLHRDIQALDAVEKAIEIKNDLDPANLELATQMQKEISARIAGNQDDMMREVAQRDLGETMWIPGVSGGDPGLGIATAPPPSLEVPGGTWWGIGLSTTIILGGGFLVDCLVQNCFQLQYSPQGSIASTPVQRPEAPKNIPFKPKIYIPYSPKKEEGKPPEQVQLDIYKKIYPSLNLPSADLLPFFDPMIRDFNSCQDYKNFLSARAQILSNWMQVNVSPEGDTTRIPKAAYTQSMINYNYMTVATEEPGRVCLRWAGWNKWSISASSQFTHLKYSTAANASANCNERAKYFNEAVRRHEGQHQRDLLNTFNSTAAPDLTPTESLPTKVCKDVSDTQRDLNKELYVVVGRIVSSWWAGQEDGVTLAFHRSLEGGPLILDCTGCGERGDQDPEHPGIGLLKMY
jgi:hypothetical protein